MPILVGERKIMRYVHFQIESINKVNTKVNKHRFADKLSFYYEHQELCIQKMS